MEPNSNILILFIHNFKFPVQTFAQKNHVRNFKLLWEIQVKMAPYFARQGLPVTCLNPPVNSSIPACLVKNGKYSHQFFAV